MQEACLPIQLHLTPLPAAAAENSIHMFVLLLGPTINKPNLWQGRVSLSLIDVFGWVYNL